MWHQNNHCVFLCGEFLPIGDPKKSVVTLYKGFMGENDPKLQYFEEFFKSLLDSNDRFYHVTKV
jgi:hypothetical protein